MRVTVFDHANGCKVAVELDTSVTFGDIIESTAAYFEKEPGPYGLRRKRDNAFFNFAMVWASNLSCYPTIICRTTMSWT